MSEEKARKDFVGFSRDIQELRYTLRSALGLSPMRPLERMRMNTQALSERLRPQGQPQQNPGCAGQRTLPRPFGLLDALRQQQGQQPQGAEPPLNSEEEEKARRQAEEEWHRREMERLRKEKLERIRGQNDFSPVLD